MSSFLSPILGSTAFRAAWVPRIEGIPVSTDRDATLAALEPAHRAAVSELGFSWSELYRAEQVHGAEVAEAGPGSHALAPGADGLFTNTPGTLLGIYVADCGALYLADPVNQAIALLHSGKKGTELGILTKAVEQMRTRYGSNPAELIVVLGPCIRPPAYDIDFAATIREQALAAGILPQNYHDTGECTSADPTRHYSYRTEKGATGRMLALLGLPSEANQ